MDAMTANSAKRLSEYQEKLDGNDFSDIVNLRTDLWRTFNEMVLPHVFMIENEILGDVRFDATSDIQSSARYIQIWTKHWPVFSS